MYIQMLDLYVLILIGLIKYEYANYVKNKLNGLNLFFKVESDDKLGKKKNLLPQNVGSIINYFQ